MKRTTFSLLLILSGFCLVRTVVAVEPIPIKLSHADVTVKIDEQKDLALSRDGVAFLKIQEDLPDVTEIAVSKWCGEEGIFIVAEVEGFKDTRSYWWMTISVPELPKNEGEKQIPFVLEASDEIFANTKRLKILNSQSPWGDSIAAVFLDEAEIPGTDRKLTYTFIHDCPISKVIKDSWATYRGFMTPDAIKKTSRPNNIFASEAQK